LARPTSLLLRRVDIVWTVDSWQWLPLAADWRLLLKNNI